ncbi:MarR family winged helix-turn-helix transcriptional regulator [Vagococcus luciliae]|nr:MarR family transcriptional regulator [Vagococcus luciliae]
MERWLDYTNQHNKLEKKLENTLKRKVNLSLNEYYVLYYLGKTPSHCIKLIDISKYFNLSQSAMSRMMVRMESEDYGMIERKTCLDDKRGIYIHLTEKGKNMLIEAERYIEIILNESL